MTDYATPTGDPGGQQSASLTPQELQAWIADQQKRLDQGLPLDRRGIPPGYKVDSGRIVPQNWWDEWGKGAAIGMGAGIGAGYGAGYLNDLLGAGSVSGLGPTTAENMAATQAAMNGATVPASLTAPGAGSVLTATQIGNGTFNMPEAGGGWVPASESTPGILPSTPIGNGAFNMPTGAAGDGWVPGAGNETLPGINSATAGSMNTPYSTLPSSTPSGSGMLSAATTPLMGGSTADNIKKALITLTTAFGGRAIANATAGNAVPPQLSDLLNQAVQRQKELAPLGTAATAGMYQMLPDFAKTAPAAQGAQSLLGVKANG